MTACIVIIAAILLSVFTMNDEGEKVKGIKDYVFIATGGMNEYFREDESRRNALLITCSTLLDILVLVGFYRFAVYATTYRLAMALVVFYSFRLILLQLAQFEQPEGYNWGWPGWFSLTVSYGQTQDFFYSGHVGICMIHFLEFYAVGWYWLSAYALVTLVMQVILMYALRSHYTVDMIAGIVFAHYFWILSEKYSYLVDWHIFRIPLEKRMARDQGLSKEEIQAEI